MAFLRAQSLGTKAAANLAVQKAVCPSFPAVLVAQRQVKQSARASASPGYS